VRRVTPEKQPWNYVLSSTVVLILGKVGCLTLVIALGALFTGLLVDNLLGTRPWLTIGFFVISLPLASVLIYKLVKSSTAHLVSKPKPFMKISEEENSSE
jgi:F0F1-type ATP synthase assembly protein I